jgi:PEP-CTERM motif-containing protein
MKKTILGLGCAAAMFMATSAQAAYVLDIDIDGLDDGPITFNPNFSFGGDATTGSTSIASLAVGTNGADSLFNANTTDQFDTFIYSYTPAVDGNSTIVTNGAALNAAGDIGSTLAAGGSGLYRVYATWPWTNNVSGGDTSFILNDGVNPDLFNFTLDQNDGGAGTGGEWIFLGEVTLDANTTYTLSQAVTGSNTFVSMRAAAVMFDAVPEPASLGLLTLGGLALLGRKRS